MPGPRNLRGGQPRRRARLLQDLLQLPPSLEQWRQYLQFLQALQVPCGLHVAHRAVGAACSDETRSQLMRPKVGGLEGRCLARATDCTQIAYDRRPHQSIALRAPCRRRNRPLGLHKTLLIIRTVSPVLRLSRRRTIVRKSRTIKPSRARPKARRGEGHDRVDALADNAHDDPRSRRRSTASSPVSGRPPRRLRARDEHAPRRATTDHGDARKAGAAAGVIREPRWTDV